MSKILDCAYRKSQKEMLFLTTGQSTSDHSQIYILAKLKMAVNNHLRQACETRRNIILYEKERIIVLVRNILFFYAQPNHKDPFKLVCSRKVDSSIKGFRIKVGILIYFSASKIWVLNLLDFLTFQ